MTNQQFKTAIVGIGWWADEQAKAVAASDGLHLHSCFTRTVETRQDFARRHDCRAASSFDDLLSDDELQAVILTTPDDTHAELTVQAAHAGKHVFVEKPMAVNAKECSAMIEACRAADVRLGVGHGLRFMDWLQQAKAIVETGRLGEILTASGGISAESGKSIPPEAWRSSRQRCPAGVLSPIGSHLIDAMDHLLGAAAQPADVAAFMSRKLMPGESHNVASLQVRYDNDVVASCYAAHVAPWLFNITLLGSEANLYIDSPLPFFLPNASGRLELQPAGGTVRQEVAVEWRPTGILQLDAFAAAIRQGAEYAVDGEQGRRPVAIIDAAIQSAASGTIVPVDL